MEWLRVTHPYTKQAGYEEFKNTPAYRGISREHTAIWLYDENAATQKACCNDGPGVRIPNCNG